MTSLETPEEMTTEEATTFEELMKPLQPALEEIEKNRFIHHLETFAFTPFVTLMIYYFTTGTKSGRLLLTNTISVPSVLGLASVPRSTFFDAFNRFSVSWFSKLMVALLGAVVWIEIPELQTFGKLYVIDGSIFPAIAKMLWAEYRTNCKGLKLHLLLDLNQMTPVHFLIGSGNSNEKLAFKQMIEAEVTYIADRGYVKWKLLTDIVLAQAHFVIRMKANLKCCVVKDLPVVLPDAARHLLSGVTDQTIILTGAKGKPTYRLVQFLIGGKKILLLTDRLDLTTFQVILLYSYRWQVELMFRFLKRDINGLHLVSTSERGVTIQFYLLMITALLHLHLKQKCVSACLDDTPKSQLPLDPTEWDDFIAQRAVDDTNGQLFLATVGDKLHQYWKISVHWIQHLRDLLAQPFDQRAIELLGGT